MSCDVGEVTEGLENEQSSFQPFCCFTYVTAHSPTLLSLLLLHRLFTYVTWRAANAFPSDQLLIRGLKFSKVVIQLAHLISILATAHYKHVALKKCVLAKYSYLRRNF